MADWGEPWESEVVLEDGRPAALGLDTCLYHGPKEKRMLTALNLRTGRTIQQVRVEA